MQLVEFEIYSLRIPFAREVSHSLHTWNETSAIVAIARDEHGRCGFGEGTPRSFVTGETLEAAKLSAPAMGKTLIGTSVTFFSALHTALTELGGSDAALKHPAAWAALEIASLDLWARSQEVPLWRLFSERTPDVDLRYSAVLPLVQGEPAFAELLELIRGVRINSVKIKVSDLQSGLSTLSLSRDRLGPDVDIRVDANAAFSAEEALAFIEAATSSRISALEQPVPGDDLDGMAWLTQRSELPIIADESMYTDRGVAYLIEHRICHGLNVRLSSCGGILKSLKVIDHAAEKGLFFQIGANVGESALLSMAGRHVAMLRPTLRYLEGSFSRHVLSEDVSLQNISFAGEGRAELPAEPGLGIDIDPDVLKRRARLISMVS